MNNEEERIHLFIKGLNSELHVLSTHMNFARSSFYEVRDFVNKADGVRQGGQVKELTNKAKNSRNFQGYYSIGLWRPTLADRSI